MIRKIIFLCLIFFPFVNYGQGAIEKQYQLNENVFFGGGFGLQFGSVNAIEVSPMVGYIPKDNLYFGVKGTYQYYKVADINYSTSIYGGSLFGMYNFFQNGAAYAEFEMLSMETGYFDVQNKYPDQSRFWVYSPLVGGGFVQPLGGRTKIMILLLFNINETPYSPYSNPVVRVNFLF